VQPALSLLQQLLPRRFRERLEPAAKADAKAALRRIAALVEKVVAAAPKKLKERKEGDHGSQPQHRQQAANKSARLALQPAATRVLRVARAARPAQLLRRWAAVLRGAVVAAEASAAGGTDASTGQQQLSEEQPGPVLTGALGLAVSLLFIGAESGIVGESSCASCLLVTICAAAVAASVHVLCVFLILLASKTALCRARFPQG
jgi:hypothetical protein